MNEGERMSMSLRTCASVFLLLLLATAVSLAGDKEKNVRVDIRDACDPATFDAAIGPGTCAPDHSGGTITFDAFLAELAEEKSVGAWRFNPDALTSKKDLSFTLRNKGGEFHTFTKVAEFGGGLVPVLNQLGGFGATRPECLAAPSDVNVPLVPGQTAAGPTVGAGETANFQCCIHPWMRTTVTAEGHEHHH
jgi:hypothetical protein